MKKFELGAVMIIYASVLHTSWALLGFIDISAAQSTALAGIVSVFGYTWAPYVLVGVGLLATNALYFRSRNFRLMLMIPQQIVMFISAYSSGLAVWFGQYADGTSRPWAFILADQLPALIAAVCYSVAIVLNCNSGGNR